MTLRAGARGGACGGACVCACSIYIIYIIYKNGARLYHNGAFLSSVFYEKN